MRLDTKNMIVDAMRESDISVRELSDKTGLTYGAIYQHIKDMLEKGLVKCVSPMTRVGNVGKRGNTPTQARYALSFPDEYAKELIYRLVDKLVDHDLDDFEIALVKQCGTFLKVDYLTNFERNMR